MTHHLVMKMMEMMMMMMMMTTTTTMTVISIESNFAVNPLDCWLQLNQLGINCTVFLSEVHLNHFRYFSIKMRLVAKKICT